MHGRHVVILSWIFLTSFSWTISATRVGLEPGSCDAQCTHGWEYEVIKGMLGIHKAAEASQLSLSDCCCRSDITLSFVPESSLGCCFFCAFVQ